MRQIKKIIIHCAATPSGMDVGRDEIDAWHKERGWSGIGYHFLIRISGEVEEGRPLSQIGAHAKGYNRDSIGICLIGGKGGEFNFTREQMGSLEEVVVALIAEYPDAEVIGHCDVSNKTCPNFNAKQWWQGARSV